jgi:hypothetical protein
MVTVTGCRIGIGPGRARQNAFAGSESCNFRRETKSNATVPVIVARFISAILLLVLLSGGSDEPAWEYPFGPWTEPADARMAARFERLLALPGGTARAIRQLCASDSASMGVKDRVATNFLLKHADQTLPLLLDMMARAERAPDWSLDSQCLGRAGDEVLQAICFGYDIGGSGPSYDAHPLAVERRARAQRVLVGALERGRRRGEMAMDVLLDAGASSVCPGLNDVMRSATPVLVKRLGLPPVASSIPGSPRGAVEAWERALRALSFGGVDPAIAEAAVSRFLSDDNTAPLATLTLARMGTDVSARVTQLARILDRIAADPSAPASIDSTHLNQLSDTLAALTAIGAPARTALPSVAAIVSRVEVPECRALGAARYVEAVRAISNRNDGHEAVACLAPLLQCSGSVVRTVQQLGAAGEPARVPLLALLRDDRRTLDERLAAMQALDPAGQLALGADDRRLVSLLQAKRKSKAELLASYPTDAGPAAELRRCRGEAGLDEREAGKARVSWSFANCISDYLCGPGPVTYEHTLARCCRVSAERPRPDFCPAP